MLKRIREALRRWKQERAAEQAAALERLTRAMQLAGECVPEKSERFARYKREAAEQYASLRRLEYEAYLRRRLRARNDLEHAARAARRAAWRERRDREILRRRKVTA